MTRRVGVRLAASLAVVLAPFPARAAYDDVGVSARVTGMGMAYTAVADDVYATYYNPAGLATLERPEAATSYSRLLTGLSDGSNIQNSFLAYAYPLNEGRDGTVAVAWNYFTLDSLYRESSLFASYGRAVTPEDSASPLFLGVSGKYLERTLGGTLAASNALTNTGQYTGLSDPGLQSTAKSNFDMDLGALWRVRPRWNLGLDIQHVLQPNIAFSPGQNDQLGRNIKFGAAYKTPFSTLSTDVDFITAPDGSLDKDLNIGVEKWLPTLLYGSFAVRGGLGYGSRDYRQISVGLSYKIHRMQIDYGFSIPVGGLTQTSGNQRVGLTWRFGAAKQADALLGQMMLENMTSAAPAGTPEFEKQAADLAVYKRKAVDTLMQDAEAQAQLGRFTSAHERSRQAASLAPHDAALAELDERYRTAVTYFPEIASDNADSAGAVTQDGVMKFIAGKYLEALASLRNAQALKPSPATEGLIRVLEARVGTGAPPAVSAEAAVSTAAVSQTFNSSGRLSDETRKRILQTVLEEIIVTVSPEQISLKLHWKGGDHTALSVAKSRAGQHRWKTSAATEQLIVDLARVATDSGIAAILNRLSVRTAKGHTWTEQRVRTFRNDHGVAVYREGERAEREEATLEESAGRLGVSKMTVVRLIKDKLLPAKQACVGAPYVIRQADLDLPTVRRAVKTRRALSPDPRQRLLEYQ